jgi:hypothetical protein
MSLEQAENLEGQPTLETMNKFISLARDLLHTDQQKTVLHERTDKSDRGNEVKTIDFQNGNNISVQHVVHKLSGQINQGEDIGREVVEGDEDWIIRRRNNLVTAMTTSTVIKVLLSDEEPKAALRSVRAIDQKKDRMLQTKIATAALEGRFEDVRRLKDEREKEIQGELGKHIRESKKVGMDDMTERDLRDFINEIKELLE